MLIHRVPDQLRRLIVTIRLLSWDRQRDAAPVDDQLQLAAATLMNVGDCSRAIAEGRKMGLLRVLRLGGRWWFELLPDSAVWIERSTTKVEGERATKKKSRRAPDSEEIARAREAWAKLENDGDPAQGKLPIADDPMHPPLGDGGFGDAMAESNRDQADAKLRLGNSQSAASPAGARPQELGNSQFSGQNPNSRKLGNSQFTHAGGAGARDHDHKEEPTGLMIHDHDSVAAENGEALSRPVTRNREELGPLQQELFDEIATTLELRDEQMTVSYERLWCERISLNPREVRDALATTQMQHKEGDIKRSIGGTLNKIFLDYVGKWIPPWRRAQAAKV
ncbi:MAG: hypothetical protein P4L99_27985 [Chthoniobacter sp.]|nr:hypothetical protein [Chthoniobacter sp.]